MLAMRRRLLDEVLEGFLVEHAGVDRPFVQLAEGQKSGQGDPTIPGLEGKVLKQGEKERGRLLVELRVSVPAEHRGPRTLDRILEPEGGFHHPRLRAAAAELG